jgi:hypothetical protein
MVLLLLLLMLMLNDIDPRINFSVDRYCSR